MGNSQLAKLLLVIGIILFNSLHCYGLKHRNRPSPKLVAQRTGAAKFEEFFIDENASTESKLKKRYSQDPDIEPADSDPEIYQGVLGRPGVDFPVMTTIPNTNFDCSNLGNGYFADLETSCQVFHICDEGRKISFLCPNGTIFRQIDLICDWWFKVDCNSAPEHYAESSEQLQRAQRLRQHKLRHLVRSEQGFGASGEIFFRNDARPAESIQKPALRLPQGRAFQAPNSQIKKRMDNNDDVANKAGENLNAADVLYSRRNSRKGREKSDDDVKGREIQETAESASFVKDKSTYSGYSYPTPSKINGYEYPSPDNRANQYLPPQQGYNYPAPREDFTKQAPVKPEKIKNTPFLQEPKPFNTRPTEMYATTIAQLELSTAKAPVGKSLDFSIASTTQKPQKSTAAASTVTRRGSTTYMSSLKAAANKESVSSRIQTVNSIVGKDIKATTVSYDTTQKATYSTARKPSTGKPKETAFYTPTIPTVREIPTTSTTTPVPITTTRQPETTTIPTNSEIVKHALEMMESLKDLDMADVIPTEAERYMGQRTGLEVPPSSGPNALHSLALYFANGDTNNTKRMIESVRAAQQDIASVFLSDKTVTKYEELFPNERRSTEPTVRIESEAVPTTAEEDIDNDLETQHSKHPIASAVGTPQLREIAQVFTHALSAYLQDPEQFRKILSEIRPTQPPPLLSNEIPRFPGENDFVRQESAYNIPRATGTTGKPEDLEIFDFSDVTTPTKNKFETTTEFAEEITTTEPTIISTTYYPQVTETLPPASSNLADKTPASRLLTESSEKAAADNLRTPKELVEPSLPANEINGGLVAEPQRYNLDIDNSESYFPENRGSKSKLNPYGFDVKPENSTPIHDPFPTSLSDTQAIPLRWGEELTTIEPVDEVPTVYADLLPPFDINGTEVFKIPNNDIQSPSEETDEHLQHAQSQSFVAARNNIYSEMKKSKTYNNDYLNYNEEFLLGTTNFGEKIQTTSEIPQTTTVKGHFVTKSIPVTTTFAPETTTQDYPSTTPYPETVKTTLPDSGVFSSDSKTTLSYTVFLDPLTINDGLMESEEESTVTPSPNTYLPKDLASTEIIDQTSTTHSSTQRRGKSSFATTPLTIRFAGEETNSIEPMQKRANEMFGNLNETQVNHLMNVMKKADENKTVKRLILLLIQTCDGDDHNKTLEESRTALLNALIGMDNVDADGRRSEIRIVNTRREKSLRTTTTTTTSIPITTYKSPYHEKYASSEIASKELVDPEGTTLAIEQTTIIPQIANLESEVTTQEAEVVTTEAPVTSTSTTTTTTTEQTASILNSNRSRSIDTKPKFRLKSNGKVRVSTSEHVRVQKGLGLNEEYVAEPSQKNSIEHKRADARALELLRSLYSLASRWGKK